jgi:hypothetical protein
VAEPPIGWVFPDVQDLLVDAMAVWVGGDTDRVDSETPDNLQQMLPFIRVVKMGGGRSRISDYPSVSVDVFAATYSEAFRLAERIDQWLAGPPPPLPSLDRVVHDVAPREMDWPDPDIRRFQAQYTVVTRRVRAV